MSDPSTRIRLESALARLAPDRRLDSKATERQIALAIITVTDPGAGCNVRGERFDAQHPAYIASYALARAADVLSRGGAEHPAGDSEPAAAIRRDVEQVDLAPTPAADEARAAMLERHRNASKEGK